MEWTFVHYCCIGASKPSYICICKACINCQVFLEQCVVQICCVYCSDLECSDSASFRLELLLENLPQSSRVHTSPHQDPSRWGKPASTNIYLHCTLLELTVLLLSEVSSSSSSWEFSSSSSFSSMLCPLQSSEDPWLPWETWLDLNRKWACPH